MIIERQKYKTFPPAMWQPEEDISDPPAGYGFTPDSMPEKDIYFFHSDHLGSTSYLTDSAGSVCQFVCYTPYGEAFVDEHSTTYENPFKFSGKELDDVTGLYDHGARSRDPKTSLWLGVDPLWEKYPDFSPYSYCMANPVRLVDPDGQAVYGRQNEDGTMSYIVGENGDITAEGYTWIDDSYDCMDENGNYKQLPGGQSTQSSQTAQATQSAPQTVENTGSPDKSMWKSFYDAFLAPGALEGHSDPANTGVSSKKWENNATNFMRDVLFEPLNNLNPIMSITNDISSLSSGSDIYGNEASSLDKRIAVADIATLGAAKYLKFLRWQKAVAVTKTSRPIRLTNNGASVYVVLKSTDYVLPEAGKFEKYAGYGNWVTTAYGVVKPGGTELYHYINSSK